MPTVGRWTGREALALRTAMRLSSRAFAEHLGVAPRTVALWEAKLTGITPRPDGQAILDTALGRAPAEVRERFGRLLEVQVVRTGALVPVATAEVRLPVVSGTRQGVREADAASEWLDDMNRRELLRLLTLAGTALALPPTGQPEADYLADLAPLDQYAALNTELWRVYALSPVKSAVFPLVRGHLDTLTESFAQVRGDMAHRRLCAQTADLFQLAGEIFFDGNQYTDAAHCYTVAASAAREAGAYDLWACALTRHAFIGVYERAPRQSVPLLQLAAELARRGDSQLSTRHWVAVVQAQAWAALGDQTACERALDTAEQVHELTGLAGPGGWLRFDGSRLAEERGSCFVELGRPKLAEAALTQAASQSPASARRRGAILVDLATVGVQRRDADELVTHANGALTVARQTGSGYVARKLRVLAGQLGPLMGSPRVRQVQADIATLTGPVSSK